MKDSSILVLGAGELGMAVLRNLTKSRPSHSGSRIAVLLRPSTISSDDPAKQRDITEIRSLGVEILPGDIGGASEQELAALFEPFDTVIGCTGFVGGRGTQRKLTRAALKAGVRRYIPWQFGVDYDVIGRGSAQDLFDEQLDVRDLLRQQHSTEWVIISTGMFTSFLFEPSFGVVDLATETVNALGSFDTSVTVTTAEDIGALTARVVFAEPRIANQVVYVGGDTVSYGRLADLLDSWLGRKMRRTEWTVAQLKEELAKEPENPLRKYRVVFAEGKGVSWPLEETFNAQHHIETMDVAGWMSANLSRS